MTASIHPASLPADELMAECETKRTRRSGPGGQHRNKVETAVVITHKPTGVRAEAAEERSQARNRTVAISRLRLNLALNVRTDRGHALSEVWQSRCRNGRISVSEKHEDYAALVAEALDHLVANELDLKTTAESLGCSTAQFTKLLAKSLTVFQWLNDRREANGLHPLRSP